ncbi:dihydroxyacetone kinase subunit DhaK [Corynebacterium uterequi]|uniref:Dihydroxyacetone kinase, DhaK subunit n=1 Tax=Corynebacterium uterequi TaxID=1072256 RepID=A0A0G3HG62_9CORY|nr:dihydroxyacetone kinase subunit DhaK [Corynebacterium uterequi]AKK10943.1 dihydroxyacetone kinase, DhaK subunit [Corynebacterium uterequi]
MVKKLVNDPHSFVEDSLRGFARAHADLVAVESNIVIRRTPKPEGKVGIISGGGSGHEPLHAGFVGVGMLDAAVPGAVFTSPTPDPILAATTAADHGAGVVYLVKNYTGDVLNFDTAAELSELSGIEVRQVLIDDDVAVEDSLYTAGRRGVAGTFLVEKVVGASAERGDSLDEVVAIAERAVANVATMGLALAPCTVPHAERASFDLADDEIELGVGIHGEPGRRTAPMATADELTDQLFDAVQEELALTAGERVVVLVNGLGATPLAELYIVFARVAQRLDELGVQLVRSHVGDVVTSLDMAGVSVTLLRVDDELLDLYDAPACTPAFRR